MSHDAFEKQASALLARALTKGGQEIPPLGGARVIQEALRDRDTRRFQDSYTAVRAWIELAGYGVPNDFVTYGKPSGFAAGAVLVFADDVGLCSGDHEDRVLVYGVHAGTVTTRWRQKNELVAVRWPVNVGA